MHDLRPVAREDIDAAAAVLGRAFADAPGYLATLGFLSPDARRDAVRRVKKGFVQAAVRHQVAEGVWRDGRLVGVALVCAPGQYPYAPGALPWMAAGPLSVGPRGVANFVRIGAWLDARHPRAPHWYLFVLGVDPDHQGRGLGGALLRRVSARADATGLPCYLETDRPENVKLYRAAGYEVVVEDVLPALGGLRMWTMQRPPA